ncbi:hypothetical protein NIES39_G00130 [Arthrospira platensis NIES-39]|nr:hypothetical protein NIES39_G00130 [Arthrospira platensis NIES-39]
MASLSVRSSPLTAITSVAPPRVFVSVGGEGMFQNQPRQQQKIIPQAINVQRY